MKFYFSKIFLFALLLFVGIPTLGTTQGYNDSDYELGSGFVEVQGGWLRVLGSGRKKVEDSTMILLEAGFDLGKEFKTQTENEAFTFGPKLGVGVGTLKATRKADLFYDALIKIRFSLGQRGDTVRFFLDAGPGINTYGGSAFQVEGGGGVRFLFGTGTFGLHGQYKQVIGSNFLDQGVEFLASLGYQF